MDRTSSDALSLTDIIFRANEVFLAIAIAHWGSIIAVDSLPGHL